MCLSSVLTGANMAMYQTGVADFLQHQPSVNNVHIGTADFGSIMSGKQHNEARPISHGETIKFTLVYHQLKIKIFDCVSYYKCVVFTLTSVSCQAANV